ncbi:MAG: lytic murein transglycosylase [Nitrospirota bacterium]|nr:lytic murein transglycosylase [Nitrospirota bacterium]
MTADIRKHSAAPRRAARAPGVRLLAALVLAIGCLGGGGAVQGQEPAARPDPQHPGMEAMNVADFLQRPDYQSLLNELVTRHKFDRAQLEGWFGQSRVYRKVQDKFDSPAEAKPYAEYRNIFISQRVKDLGRQYLEDHRELLAEVHRRTGVEPTVVAAIMGIETKFGNVRGGYRAFDALNSAFALHPTRQEFFRKELIEYLLLCREEGQDPFAYDGSYAGALGMPQFMPSSFRRYAVDFDGDGQRDIWTSNADVAGSIGNYLSRHGWRSGEPLALEVELSPEQAQRFNLGHKERFPLQRLLSVGVTLPPFAPAGPTSSVAVVSYDESDGRTRYFVLFNNFFSIMRYNVSVNYAMVAKELDDFFEGLT